ncbi:hypothetical protein GKG47_14220 [Lactonifactor sp. BIOML-A3]|uniref:hypothetical protein n=1 Tax=unclassified Lactonifactor TaxID=2636670 RepID=UPI0012AFA7F5|nr:MULTISPECIES: hypothetical protein [unclassified Lactonifactor]MSA02939.1 hypothetical protein [Lactonifactor sp. BIOML-A5]MSA10247.1 hypothetical protein [Lactonifactor sp. BIOML-A4]MSA13586.1 hypothetical protein [Lactonifactor sp. BIOML-A3]MSA19220.1 hypothetical protein [Lactonifactor sp. BIOML-A2]MSA39140.1 hypothetical protein [Lactonifactor sp. BIOML-A1]
MRIEERAALLKKVEKITDEMEEVRKEYGLRALRIEACRKMGWMHAQEKSQGFTARRYGKNYIVDVIRK